MSVGSARREVLIVDRVGDESRLLRVDDSGLQELPFANMDALAGELLTTDPGLILVSPEAISLSAANLAQELNRLLGSQAGYAWDPAPGEMAGE